MKVTDLSTLKILSLRLRGAKAEIEDAGESTDGMASSTSKLREQVAALTNIDGTGGVDIMANEKEFKSTFDIMQQIAQVYDQMDDIDQAEGCLSVQKCAVITSLKPVKPKALLLQCG